MSNASRAMQCNVCHSVGNHYSVGNQSLTNPHVLIYRIGSRLMSLFTAVSVILGSLLGFSAGVVAEENAVIEEVVVTGSRIARKELISVSPINTLDEEQIEISGSNSVATILNELPAAGIPGSVDTATNFRTTTTGLNTIDLRNLGTEKTLVLLNGRRHIGGSAG